jgi:hypothetical protein
MDDLVVREVTNGMWFLLNLALLAVFANYLMCRWQQSSALTLLRSAANQQDIGTAAAIALFVYFMGASTRAGWVWVVLFQQNLGVQTLGFENQPVFLILAVATGTVGSLCCMRVFSQSRWGHWAWIVSGILALAIPLGAHLIAHLD